MQKFVAAKILTAKQSIVVGSFYCPPSNDQAYMDRLIEAITCLCKSDPKAAYWIAGDANLPDIDWSIDQVTRHQYNLHISDSFLQTLPKTGLEQIVDFPTPYDNAVDIVLTNRPSLVSRCEGALDWAMMILPYSMLTSRAAESRRGPPNRKPLRAPLLPTPSQSVSEPYATPWSINIPGPVCWHHHVKTTLQRIHNPENETLNIYRIVDFIWL